MNLVVSPIQPVADATGARVQLPAASRVVLMHPAFSSRKAPLPAAPAKRAQPWAADRSRHRAQCRAACLL